MKIQLETISPDANSSFRLLHNPRLNDLFYWHFHPEIEVVYIEGASGTRHVGAHTSRYEGSDLVLIGSNIPHLNFDYGVKTDYEKVVLHLRPDFMSKIFAHIPELTAISNLFEKSRHGVAFFGQTKEEVGLRLKRFHQLAPFEQFLEVWSLFQYLAQSEEYTLLHDKPVENRYRKKEQQRLQQVYTFVEAHYQQKIAVEQVARLCNLSKAAFCRYFKKATGQTFIRFLNQFRISEAKRLLLLNKQVGESCYESGFESLSYFNRTFKDIVGENPLAFKKRHL